MKKVALINPGTNQEYADNEPLNLGYLASYLELNGIEVKIIDQLSGADIRLELRKFKPDFVGITATTPVVSDAYKILSYARSEGYITIIGGVHASVLPEEASDYADYVVIGEGESVLLDIVRGVTKEKIIKGIPIKNIDDIPPPARHLMNMDFYVARRNRIPTAHLYFLSPTYRLASMITSRGCPYDCIFCHNSWRGLPVRYNSVERVLSEIEALKRNFRVDALFFMDDDFFVSKRRVFEICMGIKKNKLKIIWSANARVSSVDEEILRIAKEAGLRQISFGIESGSQRILDILGKKTTVAQGERAIKAAKSVGLLVYATFMIGNPTETIDDINMTYEFILKNKIDSIGIGITTPYPGTKLWRWCKERHLIPERIQWKDFNMESCPISANEYFSNGEIEKIRSKIIFNSLVQKKFKFVRFYLKAAIMHPVVLFAKFSKVLLPLIFKPRRKRCSPRD